MAGSFLVASLAGSEPGMTSFRSEIPMIFLADSVTSSERSVPMYLNVMRNVSKPSVAVLSFQKAGLNRFSGYG